MTDARADFAGALNEALGRIERIEATMLAMFSSARVTIADIARDQGVSATTLYRDRWRMPGYGAAPDAAARPRDWWLSTYRAWIARPAAERMAGWDLMSAAERRKIIRATRREAVA